MNDTIKIMHTSNVLEYQVTKNQPVIKNYGLENL